MNTIQLIISIVLSLCVMLGISMMSKVKTAVKGNLISAFALLLGVIETLYFSDILTAWSIYPFVIVGTYIGVLMARHVKMIQMPQLVALFNGLGGGASALVGILSATGLGFSEAQLLEINELGYGLFVNITSMIAIAVGMVTLVGSLVAAGKLHRIINQRPMIWFAHSAITALLLVAIVVLIIAGACASTPCAMWICVIGCVIASSLFGLYFAVRVGGADMPITISLLNSLSGVAGAIAGMAISDIFLVAVGGIVGASGLLLTQIMCRAMNRSLVSILLGTKPKVKVAKEEKKEEAKPVVEEKAEPVVEEKKTAGSVLADAKDVIIVPGYGMALAQAQHLVKQLSDTLESRGARVRYAIHPVAGRMPGHMNVLLAEADVPYEKLFEMEAINDDFAKVDAVVVSGASDVTNPAARSAEGTPIYGMPVLSVDAAPNVIICNYDLKPGYAGVENPLYTRENGVFLELGDAKETLQRILGEIAMAGAKAAPKEEVKEEKATVGSVLADAKDVIIVPGYGMALAQAQHLVKQLSDTLESRGARVRYAIHPVAGRMPGHMNVLLAEADVPYEKLFEMEAINDDFAKVDAVVVIGANDVTNPAARSAEGTPIYGMPVLSVDAAPNVIICNYDLKPGSAGVENPLYTRENGVFLELGDAKETLQRILGEIAMAGAKAAPKEVKEEKATAGSVLADAKDVIIVPGYGMALAQAQHLVKQLSDTLESRGARVRYAIHPVAGRMPGHMNVLLAEADVPYEKLFEMEAINDDFAKVDAVVVIGANDVTNPAARSAEGTPIYGMPVLSVDAAPNVIICNYDLKPGYAGVENPLYTRENGVFLELGDAKETLQRILGEIAVAGATPKAEVKEEVTAESVLAAAKDVIIVPGYGMALAQAQHLVKQLSDTLESRGARVRYAIHPVAGRMPGHMNVLLAEADVPYEKLFEMEAINDDFAKVDAVVVIGANDVTNPAARSAEGTPIYGMPVLSVDAAPNVIICNYDLKPGYAGVENPLYTRKNGVFLKLGDAKESLQKLIGDIIAQKA